jgi:putative NADH-flavin reductase
LCLAQKVVAGYAADMRIVVFGASGKTGKQIVAQALERGHEVTALVRAGSEGAMTGLGSPGEERLRVCTGDIFDLASVKGAVEGQEAVICALGSSSLSATTVRSAGTRNIVEAMQETGVARLLVMSAMGVGESWPTLSFFNRLFFATLLRSSRRDHEAQEAAVKASRLNWTILRPSGLTDGPLDGHYELGESVRGKTARISRANVAKALIDALEDGSFERGAATITN